MLAPTQSGKEAMNNVLPMQPFQYKILASSLLPQVLAPTQSLKGATNNVLVISVPFLSLQVLVPHPVRQGTSLG